MSLKDILTEMSKVRSHCIGCTGLINLAECVDCSHEQKCQELNLQAQAHLRLTPAN